MGFDLLTIGEALVEVMRTGIGQPLHTAGNFIGPYPSGAPFIFAAQAARLGIHCAAIGSVGDDAFGQCLIEQLDADAINREYVRVSETKTTGVAFVAYNADGSRNFVFSPGAAGELSPDMLNPSIFEGLRCLHLMGSTLSLNAGALATGKHALKLAKESGARFSFDPNLRPELMPVEKARDTFAEFVEVADVLIPTEQELLILTGQTSLDDAIAILMAQNPERIIVVTQGAGGCTVYHANKAEHIAGFSVEEVDPTGAGDCFDAGFLAAWLNGDSLQQSARLANACGALAVTRQGPMAGAEKLILVQAFMAGQ